MLRSAARLFFHRTAPKRGPPATGRDSDDGCRNVEEPSGVQIVQTYHDLFVSGNV